MFIIAGYPFAVAGCLALFLAVCGMTFTFKPLIYLGKISYGLYVYHLLALLLVGIALGGKTDTRPGFCCIGLAGWGSRSGWPALPIAGWNRRSCAEKWSSPRYSPERCRFTRSPDYSVLSWR